MRVEEDLESVIVLAVDHGMEWLVATALDAPRRPHAGIDRVTKLRDDDQVVKRTSSHLRGGVRSVLPDDIGHASAIGSPNLNDAPETRIH